MSLPNLDQRTDLNEANELILDYYLIGKSGDFLLMYDLDLNACQLIMGYKNNIKMNNCGFCYVNI